MCPGPLFKLSIQRKFEDSTGSDFVSIMIAGSFGIYPKPKHIIWPWTATFHYYNVSRPEDQYIILHNTNATCADAGVYRCHTEFDMPSGPLFFSYNKTQLLRKK
ncbi:unnamed protein product, partial [Lymnaea stagnalis]